MPTRIRTNHGRTASVLVVLVAGIGLAGCAARPAAEVWVRNDTETRFILRLTYPAAVDGLYVEITPNSLGLARGADDPPQVFLLMSEDCRPVAGGAIKQPVTGFVIDGGGVDLQANVRIADRARAVRYRSLPACFGSI
jgi:hypothetical protein